MKFLKLLGSVSSFVAPSPAIAQPPAPDLAREILLSARGFLKEKGWTQGSMTDAYGRICSAQAIEMGAMEVSGRFQLRDTVALRATIQARGRLRAVIGQGEITLWNDTVCWNRWQVRSAFSEAAKG